MNRVLKNSYDVLIIGGGITGACIAWDAALRGLRTALVERDDFGGATSANSLKTVHGGLRYLQDGNLRQVRKMVRERQAFLRIAPHLVRPLPFLMPTSRHKPMRSKLALSTALKLNDLLSIDRNRGMDPARSLPAGRVLNREQCLALIPGLNKASLSGGVLWHDAQVQNTERLVLSFILSAVQQGADVANYVRVTGLLREREQVVGVTAEDQLSGQSLQIGAQVVVNAAGAWADEILADLNGHHYRPRFAQSAAMNLVTRQILPGTAVALTSHYHRPPPDKSGEIQSRVVIIAPWRQYSIVGTLHILPTGRPDDDFSRSNLIDHFLGEINQAYPAARLTREDVCHVHYGFLPAETDSAASGAVTLLRDEQLIDHWQHGNPGLITAVGVKYTTARHLAQKVVDLVFQRLKQPAPPCRTRFQPVYGGDINRWQVFRRQAVATATSEGLPAPVAAHLAQSYGTAYTQIMDYIREDRCWAAPLGPDEHVTQAEVVHAVRQEMAPKLSDVVCRRTKLGSAGPPPLPVAEQCAVLMASELGWDRRRVKQEIDDLYQTYMTID